jgi:hypothetical protein
MDADLNVAVAWTGAATNGTDHSTLPTTVTIPAGQSSLSLPVTTIDDALIETPEDVIATISTNAAYIRDTSATTATVTISDDDTPFVSVSVPDSAAAEGSANGGLFLLSRTGSTAAALKVYLAYLEVRCTARTMPHSTERSPSPPGRPALPWSFLPMMTMSPSLWSP